MGNTHHGVQSKSLPDQESIEPEDGVYVTQLVAGENMNMQHFQFEAGATAMEHSHPNEQAVFITHGTFTVILEGEAYDFEAGDSYVIPGGIPHASENRTDKPVQGIDIFSPARDGTPWD